MNRNSWWYYTEVLDRETCNRIISLANNWCQASTGGEKPELSMTILLNDDYEGGNFEFALYKDEECKKIIPDFNKFGSIVVFPSFVEHRVKPITKGERHSLVCWFVGPPFK